MTPTSSLLTTTLQSAKAWSGYSGLRISNAGFASAEDFLACRPCLNPKDPSCLVLDCGCRGISGISLQQELANAGVILPIVFITGHGNIPMSVQAMKNGAVDFCPNPLPKRNC